MLNKHYPPLKAIIPSLITYLLVCFSMLFRIRVTLFNSGSKVQTKAGGYDMDKTTLQILEKFNLSFNDFIKFRSSMIFNTNKGFIQIKKTNRALENISFIYEATDFLREKNFKNTEKYLLTSDNKPYCIINGETYTASTYIDEKNVNLNEKQHNFFIADSLAELHKSSKEFTFTSKNNFVPEAPYTLKHYEKKIKDMAQIRKWLKNRSVYNELDIIIIKNYKVMKDYADKSIEIIKSLYDSEHTKGILYNSIREYNFKIKNDKEVYYVNFENCSQGNVTSDIYMLLRKYIKRENFHVNEALELLSSYLKINPLNKVDLMTIYAQFLFPEKFFSLSNYYYNRKKSWMPAIAIEKTNQYLSVREKEILLSDEINKLL